MTFLEHFIIGALLVSVWLVDFDRRMWRKRALWAECELNTRPTRIYE